VDQSANQTQEVDIYPLALAKFLQVAPELGNNIVSYKDISEDLPQATDIKVGVFILRTGLDLFYVPVISKAENIYPIDSVFKTSTGQFFPLTKKTVMSILTASQETQGKGVKIPAGVQANPDLTNLITPPRTGKFAYASTSRLGDFLASMPEYLKEFTLTKVAEEKSVYEELNKLFAIRDIFAALKSPTASSSMARVTNQSPISIVTGSSSNLTSGEIAAILEDGYSARGEQSAGTSRVAVLQNSENTKFTSVTNLDGNSDHELVLGNGQAREAFIPKIMDLGTNSSTQSVALFTNGAYAVGQSFISVGSKLDRKMVLDTLFSNNPPVLPRDLSSGECFAVIDTDANLLGVFNAKRVTHGSTGVEISVHVVAGAPHFINNICASRNYGAKPTIVGSTIYMPFSSLVLVLKEDVSTHLERSINSAAKRSELSVAAMLGDQINIGYDNVEFSVNNKVVGSEADLMHKLASVEHIEPTLAKSFIKQAKEKKRLVVYLSKQANSNFKAADREYPGQMPAPVPKTGLNGSFMPNVQNSLKLGDAQSTEATIISELLQTPDMYDLIEEYQPDIEQCIDKLGRILFLSRVNINQLAEGNDIDSVFSFLSSLKNTYRTLGDNSIKLKEMLAIKPESGKGRG
jgi:hypothetical protein